MLSKIKSGRCYTFVHLSSQGFARFTIAGVTQEKTVHVYATFQNCKSAMAAHNNSLITYVLGV